MRGIVHATFWNGLSTGCRALSLLVIAKIISVTIGPAGLGKIGQFLSLMTILGVMAGGGLSNGLIRYIAEHRHAPEIANSYIGTSIYIALISSVAIGIAGFLFSYQLADLILGSTEFVSLIWILCIIQFIIAGSNICIAIINGHKDARRFALTTISGFLTGALATFALTRAYGLYGSLLGLMVMQASPFVFGVLSVSTAEWRKGIKFYPQYSKESAIAFSHYAIMAVATAIITPSAQIVIRKLIESKLGWDSVGYWQATVRISDSFSIFIVATLTNFYLPNLVETKRQKEVSHLIRGTLVAMALIVALGSVVLYSAKSFIIPLLFSSQFMEVQSLLPLELFGDLVRCCSWVLSYIMLARAMTGLYLATEVIFSLLNLFLSFLLVDRFGLQGIIAGATLSALMYFLTMIFIFRRDLGIKSRFGIWGEC